MDDQERQQIDELIQDAQKDLKNIGRKLKQINKNPTQSQQQQLIKECNQLFTYLNNKIDEIQLDVDLFPTQLRAVYNKQLRDVKEKSDTFRFEFDQRNQEDQEYLFGGRTYSKPIDQMNDQEVEKRGDDLLEDDLNRLGNIDRQLDIGINVGEDIIIKQGEQIGKLEDINANIYSLNHVLKRSKKELNWFRRMIQKDKCLMCMICSCLIAIIVIIVLSLTGNDNGKFSGVPKDFIEEETQWVTDQASNLVDEITNNEDTNTSTTDDSTANTNDVTTNNIRILTFLMQNVQNKLLY